MSKKTELVIINDHCCGIDVGSKSFVIATGLEDSDLQEYGVYTEDIEQLIEDLKCKGVENVAMESTGSYWQPLFSGLQMAGFDVRLVDGKQTKNYKQKTDFKDARAIYQLHSLGFLNSCFLPDEHTNSMRILYRYRQQLLQENARNINRMQKSLRLMNFRIDNSLNDIVGKSGRRIIEAIIKGQTEASYLVTLFDRRVKKTKEELLKSCKGQINMVHIYVLEDAYNAYNFTEVRISQIDIQIKELLENYTKGQAPKKGKKKQCGKNQINIGLQNLSYQYYGVDLFAIESVSYNLVMSFISEVGQGLDKFKSSKEFCSWLRLAPNNRISGGKILSSRTPKGKNPLSVAFRNAANTISKSKKGYLVYFFKRIAYKKDRGAAITATARKLAIIMYNMIKNQQEYNPPSETTVTDHIKGKVIKNIKQKLRRLNIDISEFQSVMA